MSKPKLRVTRQATTTVTDEAKKDSKGPSAFEELTSTQRVKLKKQRHDIGIAKVGGLGVGAGGGCGSGGGGATPNRKYDRQRSS